MLLSPDPSLPRVSKEGDTRVCSKLVIVKSNY